MLHFLIPLRSKEMGTYPQKRTFDIKNEEKIIKRTFMSGKKISVVLLQIGLGWLLFYSGITKILDPSWTSKGYIENAKTFSGLYDFFASPSILPIVDLLNEWGLTIIGIALLTGLFIRWASIAGILIMLLYYFPILEFPHVGHGYIVDEHIIYSIAFLVLIKFHKGFGYGIGKLIQRGE